MVLNLSGAPAESDIFVEAFLSEEGASIVPVYLRATGANAQPGDAIGRAPDHNTAEWALWTDQPLLGQWVVDVRAAIDQLAEGGADLEGLRVAGVGPAGVVALCSAALDGRIQEVTCIGTLASYISEVPYEKQRLGIMAPGILRDVGDIQHLAALVAPRRLAVIGGVAGGGKVLDDAALVASFPFTEAVYDLYGSDSELAIVSQEEAVSPEESPAQEP